MAIDFLIFGLLLISLSINLLALGAFWVTPGLRTTANRFVINLLIVNIIGSIALAPTLFLSNSSDNKQQQQHDSITNDHQIAFNPLALAKNSQQYPTLIEEDLRIVNGTQSTRTHLKCNNSECDAIIIETDSERDKIVITEIDEKKEDIPETADVESENNLHKIAYRCWSIDLAAALGALSVLLVVGDTWCAVTDPLRYHARISGLKAWILIAITWFLGMFFGVLSALRENVFPDNEHEITEETIEYRDTALNSNIAKITSHQFEEHLASIQPNELYNMIFSCLYFIVIILLPFGFVCGMYWRIFSEARENGLRMRQNGSSPLLQSALNLSAASAAHNNQVTHQQSAKEIQAAGGIGGLTLKIDRQNSDKESTKPLLIPVPVHKPLKEDRNRNILLTLSTANEDMRRNYSARHLSSLASSQDLNDSDNSLRHVHSTPNLQRDANNSSFSSADHPHHILHLPSVHVSPKALSYMTSIRHRLSNASSLFKYREESRAARISILVVIMFLISYLPYGLLVLLQGRLKDLFSNSTQIAIVMVLMANLSSPIIFAYRNKRVRRGVKRLFGLDPKSKERQLLRCGTKASINVRRSVSKASTYSVNSCKYLTPHSVNNGTFLMEIEKCHYLKNTPQKAVATFTERRSILKRMCDSSRKLGCASNSCATSDNEQTDV